jgi:hypothetical protein
LARSERETRSDVGRGVESAILDVKAVCTVFQRESRCVVSND